MAMNGPRKLAAHKTKPTDSLKKNALLRRTVSMATFVISHIVDL
jgi:hypothetical protein